FFLRLRGRIPNVQKIPIFLPRAAATNHPAQNSHPNYLFLSSPPPLFQPPNHHLKPPNPSANNSQPKPQQTRPQTPPVLYQTQLLSFSFPATKQPPNQPELATRKPPPYMLKSTKTHDESHLEQPPSRYQNTTKRNQPSVSPETTENTTPITPTPNTTSVLPSPERLNENETQTIIVLPHKQTQNPLRFPLFGSSSGEELKAPMNRT
ncbi:hypothetical protein AABB24_023066, partial [Solanum stoloniferum]